MIRPSSLVLSPARSERGVTLPELMVSLAVSSILMSGVIFGVQFYFSHFNRQIDRATARQTGRAVIDLLRQSSLRAGWGFQPSISAAGAQYLGVCFDESTPPERSTTCNNLSEDSGSDRLAIFYGTAGKFQASVPETGTSSKVPAVLDESNVADPFSDSLAGSLVFISGMCVGTSTTSHLLGHRLSDSGTHVGQNGTYRHSFSYGALPSSVSPSECGSGRTNYNFGALSVAEFKIDRTTDVRHPTLLMRTDPRVSWDQANTEVMVVGRDVDDLQVMYGIDTDKASKLDRIPDLWCSQPATTTGANACNSGLTATENLNRIVAFQIGVVVRTSKYHSIYDKLNATTMTLFDHTIADTSDGYQRWIFRTTIAVRNNSI